MSDLALPRLAARLFNTPLMVDDAKATAILEALGGRVTGTDLAVDGPSALHHVAFAGGRPSMGRLGDPLGRRMAEEDRKPLQVVDGVAVIPVEGSLVHKGKWLGSFSGDTSYEGLNTQIRAARRAPAVRGVVFEVDSYGGEVSGLFDTAAAIADLSREKPTIAILTDHALSAGYLLASAARQVVIPETGRAGSIGAVMLHADFSRQMEARGVTVTVLSAGKLKADATPYAPLPDAAAARMRADLEASRVAFATAVAGFRGDRLTLEAALATEAGHFAGPEAVRLGLADAVGRPSEAFDLFVRSVQPTATYGLRA